MLKKTEELDRRNFMKTTASCAAALSFAQGCVLAKAGKDVPSYLKGHEDLYAKDPRQAAVQWFRDADWGLFLHYSIRSMRGDPATKKKLSQQGNWQTAAFENFTAEGFDADAIADLAVDAGMQYVNMTTYHGGGPYMFRTTVSDKTTLNAPANRDLIGEMAAACRKRGLGMFMYIYPTHVESSSHRAEDNRTMLRELLTQYGPIAGIWFDGVYRAYRNRNLFENLQSHYDLIRELQPQALISFKVGFTGDEDFLAPEHHPRTILGNHYLPEEVRQKQLTLPVEICTTMQVDPESGKGQGMWFDKHDARHLDPPEVMKLIEKAHAHPANLLLNTGLRCDGSVHPHDESTLRTVGRMMRSNSQ